MTDLSLLCTAAGHADAHGDFFLIQCCGAGVWVKRFALCLARSTLCEASCGSPPPHFLRSTVIMYGMLVKLSTMVGYSIIPVYVRACCQTKVVHPACSYEALIFGFHRELLISLLGLHMEATEQFFRSDLYNFRIEIQWALESAATTLH